MLPVANVAFFVFHTALCLFNVLGWAHPTIRRWHLVTMGAVLVSWVGFGIWRGWGYCLCTDWHMQVREAMGIRDESRMYVQLVIELATGVRLPDGVVMGITGGAFGIALALSVWLNLRDAARG